MNERMKEEKIVVKISTPIPENMAVRLVAAIEALCKVNILDEYVEVTRE